jgi:repressor of nif and glnA expression
MDKRTRNRIAILNTLRRTKGLSPSRQIAERLADAGSHLSERTVRLYLSALGEDGLVESHGRRGHTITERGLAEVQAARTQERVGYLSARIDQMTYRMSFDMQARSGSVVVNTSFMEIDHLRQCLEKVCRVFECGYAMGSLAALLRPGEAFGGRRVPPGQIGFCTVCSITLNGVLLKHGVPVGSRFGGLIELQAGRPVRFVEIIRYDGTSIDPLEVFIRSGMTDYHGAIRDGCGLIGASFREVPDDSRDLVEHLAKRLSEVGLGAFMRIGAPGQPVLEWPVGEGRVGAVVVGGLNPMAILVEAGHPVDSFALSGLLEYHRLMHFTQLPEALESIALEARSK